jgi:hypothetical protein
MIGWMLFYILAIPALFLLPLYSFRRTDDFSWGVIRVLGESSKKTVVRVSIHLL